MTTCDFSVAVRIIAADGVTEVFDFNDVAGGLSVLMVQDPEFQRDKVRKTADDVDGDYTTSERDAAGDLVVVVLVQGATWAQCVTRWQAARAAYRSASRYYLETEVEGVTTRYRTEQPESVRGEETNSQSLVLREQTYTIRWHVQPNPTMTIA